ncbi:MAG: tRNA uridine-5-carboxymethylaminomethyl(34) synthesis GTPase MnmE [Clostridia bacterium]|nr:tRNA uridine-5-carboxymethylaminomethyl(34) synthesis GTPase MnmE [Clostridia bacterium]
MTDTIAAISTPYGKGGIAVIRISGDEAIDVAGRVFRAASGRALSEIEGGRIVYGSICAPTADGDLGKVIDDGMAAILRSPRSYTGEDTVEISCHGGILLTEQVLSAVIAAGARPAEAGEFTRRAFVAGKLSLTEAEAVINLIDARSEEALKLARSHTAGRLTEKLGQFYESLRTLLSTAYVYADYPDEDLTDLSAEEMVGALEALQGEMQALSDTYYVEHAVSEGITAVIVGRPNTGKSSLLNRLLCRERAIVSPIAGTTRDTIEETVQVGRVTLRLTDTAGLRESDDPIEQIGVERSLAALESAELILAVFDGAEPLSDEDRELLAKLEGSAAPKIALVNKSDLQAGEVIGLPEGLFHAVCPVSARTEEGMDALRQVIESLYVDGEIDYDSTAILANARQKGALDRSIAGVEAALGALRSGFTPDVAGLDLEEAMAALSEADGRAVSADIVDAIFHRFCVGK